MCVLTLADTNLLALSNCPLLSPSVESCYVLHWLKIVSCYSNTLASGARNMKSTDLNLQVYNFSIENAKFSTLRKYREWIFPEGINFFEKPIKAKFVFLLYRGQSLDLSWLAFFQAIRVESIPSHCCRSAPIRKKAVVVNKIRIDRQNRIRVFLMTGSNDKCFSWLRKSNYMDIFQAIVWYNFMREK